EPKPSPWPVCLRAAVRASVLRTAARACSPGRAPLDLRAVSRFSDCFLLLFGQLAVGGPARLPVPPFTLLDRGFYGASAGIFLGFALLFVAGKVTLVVRAGAVTPADAGELALWVAFTAALGTYLASLWSDSNTLRARSFATGLLLGILAL